MGKRKRFDIFRDNHIGFGVRWDDWDYRLRLSFAFPFFSITIGLGKEETGEMLTMDEFSAGIDGSDDAFADG